jgi:peptide/nickel transport system substrate-binding protein/microcin C transport system substrate-binding protein
VDYALFRQRLENYDFDMVEIAGGEFTVPSAIDELSIYGSKSADEPGNNNLRGIKLAAVDHALAAMAAAQTLPQMRDACRALDRIVMWVQAQVPVLWFAAERMNYWNRFGMPARLPQHFTVDSPSSEFPAWPVVTWWIREATAQ